MIKKPQYYKTWLEMLTGNTKGRIKIPIIIVLSAFWVPGPKSEISCRSDGT